VTKVEIPAEFMPTVEHAAHRSEIDLSRVGGTPYIPIAVVLEAAGHVYAFVQLWESMALAEALYANVYHILGCDCGRSAAIQQLLDRDYPLLPCGHTLRLIALEALPQPRVVQCPHCQGSFEVEV